MDFVDVAVQTHPGRVRSHNEDAAVHLPGLVAVADGMGGHEGGEVASALALEVLTERADALREAVSCGKCGEVIDLLNEVFQEASDRIEAQGRAQHLVGMGCTLVCALLGPDSVWVAHVGDSRAYLLRADQTMRALTADHNVRRWMRERGTDEATIAANPQADKLTMALGMGAVEPDVAEVRMGAGDTLLLCSDGLYDPVAEPDIARVLGGEDPSTSLIQAALDAGGPDNVTVVLARVTSDARSERLARRIKQLERFFLFKDFTSTELGNVAPFLELRRYNEGDALATEGETADDCLLIVEGEAVVHRGPIHLVEVGPGDHVGELALVGPWKRSADITARSRMVAYALTRQAYDDLCVRKPSLAARMGRSLAAGMASRLADLTDRLDRVQRAVQGA